jgi:hypothetical protein
MARPKKNGQFLNCYIEKEIIEKLEDYSRETSVPKTAVVEKALMMYFKSKEKELKKLNK